MIFNDFHLILLKFQWFSLIFNEYHWISMIFIDIQGARGQCWTAFGPLEVDVNDEKVVFRVGLPPKPGPVSRPPPQPSAPPLGAHRGPVGGCWAWVRVSPLKLPPTFYLYIQGGGCWVLLVALTRRRSRRRILTLSKFTYSENFYSN